MSEALIGVDVGTGSARAGVFDGTGKLIASAKRAIAIWREPGAIVEQSSDDIWRAVTTAVREAVEASALPPAAFAGMGFAATCSLVVLDPAGRPLSVSPTHPPKSDEFARSGAEVVAPGFPLGEGLTAEAAAAMGLQAGTPVGAGLIDAHAGALGTMGASAGGKSADPRRRLALILGTSACCMAVSDEPRFIDTFWGPHYSALTPDQWLTEGGQSAFGAAIDHVLRFHPAFSELSSRAGAGTLAALEEDIVARSGGLSQAALLAGGLHVLPDFLGNRSPFADAAARGGILGMDVRQRAARLEELYVAGLCGLAYEVAQIIGELERAGYDFEMIVVGGGAARSALVRQIIADACAKTVGAPQTAEPVLLGSAMIGAVAAGRRTIASAMSSMSALAESARPAGGAIATFHARKRRAFEILQRAESEIRETTRPARWPKGADFDCDAGVSHDRVVALRSTAP